MKKNILSYALAFIFQVFALSVFAQGVTTSSISGKVVDETGAPVYTATVVAIHDATGTQYGVISSEDGFFKINNMKVGGPYTVTVSYIGYKDYIFNNIYLQLNETFDLSPKLSKSVVEMEEVTITAESDDDLINSDRMGSITSVNAQKIMEMPNIDRSAKGLTRLTPESDGNSFGGRNNLYNNFSLDGSTFNNSFGLDYATPGGQSDAQPVSLDAIEQMQVSLAPFDVREGGFTGAGVNAVTKSGTNKFHGTAYYYFKNDALIGNKISGEEVPNNYYNSNLFGASVGGPIVKNKLFFFMNYEGVRRDELAHGFVAENDENAGQPGVTSVREEDIFAVQQHFITRWGYDPGKYQGYNHQTQNNKFLIKLDWNIGQNHKLMVRYNLLDAYKDILPHPEAIGGRGPTPYRLPFENESYRIFNKINSVVAELNSTFGTRSTNKLLVSYTSFKDHREPKSAQFPVIDIWNSNNVTQISAGSEMFSTNNVLNQNVLQINDNYTYYLNKHTITGGVNFEYFQFENSFNLFYYPWYTAFSTQDFLNDNYVNFAGNGTGDFNQDVTNSNENAYAESEVKVGQLALYAQDDWQVTDNFKLALGLRVDMPMYFNTIPETEATDVVRDFDGWRDPNTNSTVEVDPAKWPGVNPLWSPRVGFNWDIKGDKTMQLRGGTGVFSGRIPFVWLGNQASNSGINPGYTFQVNATAEDYKWPQVWKTNIAIDAKVGTGWILTFEGIFSKDMHATVHQNYNMQEPSGNLSGTGDTRAMFAGFDEVNIYSASPESIGFLEAGNLVLTNSNQGMQMTLTGKVVKTWKNGLNFMAAYTYLDSKDITSIPAEIAADAFQRNPVVGDPNQSQYSWSRYGLQHRVIGSLFHKFKYGNFATHIGVFYELAKGHRYSFVYGGDLNGDAINNNDLLYVPADASDINFGTVDGDGNGIPAADADEQYAALDAFIEQDNYLKTRRGEYADRNGATLPWFSQLDLRIMEDFNIKVGDGYNVVQFSLDFINIGNMFNSNWGVKQLANTLNPITTNGVANDGTPYFGFDESLTSSYADDVSINSKWQIQLALRYIF